MTSAQLLCHPLAILNQLFHLEAAQMTVRGNGLTLLRHTEFGVFLQTRNHGEDELSDPISGLTIAPAALRAVYILPRHRGAPPAIEFEFAEDGFALSVQPAPDPQSAAVIRRIRRAFGSKTVASSSLESRGAGAWLDEWETTSTPLPSCFDPDLQTSIELAEILRVCLHRPGLRAVGALKPTFIDQDASVMKVADFESGDAVFIDLISPNNHYRNDFGTIHLTHDLDPNLHPSRYRQTSPPNLQPYRISV